MGFSLTAFTGLMSDVWAHVWMRQKCLAKWTSYKIHSYQKKWVYRYMCASSENLVTCYFWVLKLHRALIYLNTYFFQIYWCFENRPYDLILPGLCMPDFESSHIGLIISWADNCIAIEVANQKLGPSPACKPKLQQAGIYYLVILILSDGTLKNNLRAAFLYYMI